MIVAWETELTQQKVTPLGVLIYNGARAALEAVDALSRKKTTTLRLHIGLGASTVHGHHVGGILGRWEYYINGDACHQMNASEAEAELGQVVMSAECHGHLQTCPDIHDLQIQTVLLQSGRYILESIEANVTELPAFVCPKLDHDVIARIASYVPGPVTSTVKAGQMTKDDASIRTLSVLFIGFHGILHLHDPTEQLDKIQATFTVVQEAAYRVHGKP